MVNAHQGKALFMGEKMKLLLQIKLKIITLVLSAFYISYF